MSLKYNMTSIEEEGVPEGLEKWPKEVLSLRSPDFERQNNALH